MPLERECNLHSFEYCNCSASILESGHISTDTNSSISQSKAY